MKNTLTRVRGRVAVLVSATALLALGSLPLIGQAQDATPAVSEQELIQQGEQIFTNVCIACHQPEGKGIAGMYPPLAGNPLLTTEDPTFFVTVLLTGRGGMPTFASSYDDEQIAAITTYVRQAWGNEAEAVSPELVAGVRDDLLTKPLLPPTPEAQIPRGIEPNVPATDGTPEATPGT